MNIEVKMGFLLQNAKLLTKIFVMPIKIDCKITQVGL